ncbi:VID27 cytoplasmic protein [Crepidotus variabilis]|uniref:VID27 cytoplasmic protein n=1 Tax=Crepidotus variabilis TaxID=179855 RepID=A0A9P6ESZ7_9AGAR|nr:VID27 cytoplasmic protein [Crepidotus variabilis]
MNIFRSLIGKVWQDPNAAEVVKISSGQLYLIRPGNIRTSRECIYNDCMATVRRLPSIEHNFQLVITKVYEDGDQDLLEDEDETDEEKVFLIGEELEFRTGYTDGEPNFVWRDLNGDIDEFFEFVAAGTNPPTCAFFETCMYRAMFERKYKKSADSVQDSALEEFLWKAKATPKKVPKRKVAQKSVEPLPSSPAAPVVLDKEETPIQQPPEAKVDSDFMSNQRILMEEEVELYIWSKEKGEFENDGIFVGRFTEQTNADFTYWITASNDAGLLLAHKFSPVMNQRFSAKMLSLTWNYFDDNGVASSWLFKFQTQETYAQAIEIYTQCLWQTLHRIPWGKIKAEEQSYVMAANQDVEMPYIEDEEDEEEAVASELDPDEEPSDDDEEPEGEDEDEPKQPLTGDRNSQLMVGYKGDRSYVVRGNNIGVFNHNKDDHSVKYYATIANLATSKGKKFKPKNVMLHDQDSKMILQNPGDPHALYSLDIERGKVVEEWKIHEDIQVDHIAPENKFAPTTREQTLVGASHNALFRIDPRVSGAKLVDSQFKQYVSKNKFSGVATTAAGKLAVASEKGDIRLFDSIGKNAKTALPPLGDPILGIDVTANGRYIVATTDTYLLLIDTLIGDGKYQGQLGFDRSFPANAKPQPKRLQLKPQHVAYMGNKIAFSPARFNQGEGQEENAIVTSTGQYVVAWDFGKVKKGKLDQYEIKKYEDHVVQDNFKFGDDKEIIVALDNNVLAVNKKNLKKPTRESLAPQSFSQIVNSPY